MKLRTAVSTCRPSCRSTCALVARVVCWGLIASAGVAEPSSAELIDRGGGLIYDSVRDITWLQDARYAQTSGFDGDGRMIWPRAMSWVADLEYYDAVRGRTWTDWRLPDARDFGSVSHPCFGYECPDSELGGLYFVHGVTPLTPAPFVNVVNEAYWCQNARAPFSGLVWVFQFRLGKQDHTGPYEELLLGYPWPVRDGDVADPPPEVPTFGLGAWLLVLSAAVASATRAIARDR
jgi:hypothetical protein